MLLPMSQTVQTHVPLAVATSSFRGQTRPAKFLHRDFCRLEHTSIRPPFTAQQSPWTPCQSSSYNGVFPQVTEEITFHFERSTAQTAAEWFNVRVSQLMRSQI